MAGNLGYDVLVNDPPSQDGLLPNGEPNAKIERYPDHLGRMILRVSASARYGIREHPVEDGRRIILASWL